MKIFAAIALCLAISAPAFAQRGTPPPPTDRTKASYMSAAEVQAAIAKLLPYHEFGRGWLMTLLLCHRFELHPQIRGDCFADHQLIPL